MAPERQTHGAVTLYDLDFHRITHHPAPFKGQDYNSQPPDATGLSIKL
jgi:hypothetical protein